jgi:hypothetical protein
MIKNIFAIGAIALLSTTSTMAQQGEAVRVCAQDVRAACGSVQPGEGRIRSCINSHIADLSPPCRAILASVAYVGRACRGDIKTICADVKPGRGRIAACIQPHIAELSAPCKDLLARAVAGKS